MAKYGWFLVLVLSLGLLPQVGVAGYAVQLPHPSLVKSMQLNRAILQRRSVRRFNSSKQLTAVQISQLLWAAGGITEPVRSLRTAPSAGGLYPLELYLVRSDGIWRYRPAQHDLQLIVKRDVRAALARAAYRQQFIVEAPLVVVIAAAYHRTTGKYGRRGIKFAYLEAGHVAQNLLLEAVSLGLAGTPVGGFNDKAVTQALKLPSKQDPLYIIPIGYSR